MRNGRDDRILELANAVQTVGASSHCEMTPELEAALKHLQQAIGDTTDATFAEHIARIRRGANKGLS